MIPTEYKLVAAGVGLVVAFGAGWAARGWRADRDLAQAAAAAEAQASAAYAAEIAAGRKALDDRERKLAEIAEANHNLSERLKEEYAKNPETRAWADTCLPDSITCLLR